MAVNYVEIGRRIAARRKLLGLKQEAVCERCGLNSKYLSNIERARSIPSIDVLLRISMALDTTPDAFLLGTLHDDAANGSISNALSHRLRVMNENQLSLISDFIDWTANHIK